MCPEMHDPVIIDLDSEYEHNPRHAWLSTRWQGEDFSIAVSK